MKGLSSIFFIILSNFLFGQTVETLSIDSKSILGNRAVKIYLPEAYQNEPNRKFEVVYVFDAQHQFFDIVPSTIYFQGHGLAPMIVVGIISENKNKDFLPENTHEETFQEFRGKLGNAKYFQKFISEELIPYIDSNYRTLPTKIAIGFSTGGTFLNYCLLEHPEMFDVYFSIDANLSYDKGMMVKKLKRKLRKNNSLGLNSTKFYYSCNTQSYDEGSQVFHQKLNIHKNIVFREDIFEEETHQSIYQIGLMNAFKAYFDYQLFNTEHLFNYYSSLEKDGYIELEPTDIHRIALSFYNNGKIAEANEVLEYYQDLLGYDNFEEYQNFMKVFEIGNMYLDTGRTNWAMHCYDFCYKKLEQYKPYLNAVDYEIGKRLIEDKIREISEK